MIKPHRHDNLEFKCEAGDVLVRSADGDQVRLTGVAAAVLLAADGSRTIGAIHELVCSDVAPDATRETIFTALDQLADLDLLTERVAPPAASLHASRRNMMKWVGAAAAVTVMAPVARGDELKEQEELEKAKRAAEEQAKLDEQKEQEELEKAKREQEEQEKQKAAEEDQKRAKEDQQKQAEESAKREAEEKEKASFPHEGEERAKVGQAKAQESKEKALQNQEEAAKRSDTAQKQAEQHQKKAQEHQARARAHEEDAKRR